MNNFWWLPYWWRVERVTEPPRCVYSVATINAGKTLNYPDKNAQNATDGSGQPKETQQITSATSSISELNERSTTFGAVRTNDAWIGNVAEND